METTEKKGLGRVMMIATKKEAKRFLLWVPVHLQGYPTGEATDAHTGEDPQCPDVVLYREQSWAYMSGLYVPKPLRGHGAGTALVREVIRTCRYWGLPVFLNAGPYGDSPMTQARLFQWYEALGFRRFPGHPFSMVCGTWPAAPERVTKLTTQMERA